MSQVELLAKIAKLPLKSGVYFYYNHKGEVIYIGKARVLRQRVRQYFAPNQTERKTQALVADIADLSHLETETELDALFLESELIKRYQPRYNILLRDDKSQIFIKISSHLPIPDVSLVRLPVDTQAEYFGPFYSAQPIRQALRQLRRVFPYLIKPYQPNQPKTLDDDIGLNPPLATEIDRQNYRQNLNQLKRYIKGERVGLVADLERQMRTAAAKQEFELASKYRNQIRNLQTLTNRIHLSEDDSSHALKDLALIELQHIIGLKNLPRQIEGFDISHLSGRGVVASMVQFKNGLARRASYRQFKLKFDQNDDFYNLAEVIKRRLTPKHLTGWGQPDLLLIDGGKGQLSAALKAQKELGLELPTISLAEREEIISVSAQDPHTKVNLGQITKLGGDAKLEGDFWRITLPASSHARRLLERIRNESHRFAVAYQTKLRQKSQQASWLDQIRGIGPATKRKLLRELKTNAKIQSASETELAKVIGPAKAKLIYAASQKNSKP